MASFRRAKSLRYRLVVGLSAVSLMAVVAETALLYFEYHNTDTFLREHTLQEDEAILISGLVWPPSGTRPVLSPAIAARYSSESRRFAIIDDQGVMLAASPGVTAPLTLIESRRARFFMLDGAREGQPFYGISERVGTPPHRVWAQIAISGDKALPFDSLLAEFSTDIAWIWLPFLMLMLAVNLLIVHYGLRPLRRASAFAAAIGPDTVSIRLPEDNLPREVLPLVRAINLALGRLEAGYEAQRAFIADTAHDLRTPLAVLKAHLDVLPDRAIACSLNEDVEAMERLVNQLLDLARVGVLTIAPDERADLHEIATDVAVHLAPLAIRSGRSIAVIGPQGIGVAGSYDFLFRATRNLVENALTHAPRGTTVTLQVSDRPLLAVEDCGPGIPEAERALLVQRFRQGGQDRRRAGKGAGLGLAIVTQIAAAHGATVSIETAPGGGARVSLDFSAAAPFRAFSA